MSRNMDGFIYAGPADELEANGKVVIAGARCPILAVHHAGEFRAMDNRCPHLGFPLHRGTIEDGILTCHWHHARFDLASGGTFDLWADDLPTCEVKVEDGGVWVSSECGFPDQAAHWRRRLGDGMAHNIRLVIGKSVLGMQAAGVDYRELVRDAALFGARYRDGWGSGMTVLAALANLIPALPETERYLALFQGIRWVASDCDGEIPRRDRQPLESESADLTTLKRWLRQLTQVRHRDGAERTVLTAIAGGASPARLADMLLTAATDRYFADGGHALDFVNKAFECLDVIGWDCATVVLPTVVGQLVTARGSEELNSWRHPVDLVPLLEAAFEQLPALVEEGRARPAAYRAGSDLAHELLDDDPAASIDALKRAIAEGARPTDLSRALAYAAALRIARLGTSNEYSDWDNAHHTFTYCNALHQALVRATGDGTAHDNGYCEAVRGVFHGAMRIYLNRYLNVPPARLPGERSDSLDDLPSDPDELRSAILEAFDRQQQVNAAARLVARYLRLGHPSDGLIVTLAYALLREDAGFHTHQNFEACVRQYREWGDSEEGHTILVAAARYLAAHAPTERAQYQTATIAQRLHRGGKVHEEDDEAAEAPNTPQLEIFAET